MGLVEEGLQVERWLAPSRQRQEPQVGGRLARDLLEEQEPAVRRPVVHQLGRVRGQQHLLVAGAAGRPEAQRPQLGAGVGDAAAVGGPGRRQGRARSEAHAGERAALEVEPPDRRGELLVVAVQGDVLAVRREGELLEVARRPDAAELPAAAVEPGRLAGHSDAGAVGQRARAGGKEGVGRSGGALADGVHGLRQRHRLAGQPEPVGIEGLRHQRALANVEQVAAGRGIGDARLVARDEHLGLRSVQGAGHQGVVLGHPGAGEVDEVAAIRQEDRPAVVALAPGLVEVRDHLVGAAARRDPVDRRGRRGREEDHPGAAPGAAAAVVGAGERLRRTAREIHPHELAVGEEAEGAAVGRPEREPGALGAGKGPGLQRGERAHPDLAPALRAGDEGELAAVRRHRQARREVAVQGR